MKTISLFVLTLSAACSSDAFLVVSPSKGIRNPTFAAPRIALRESSSPTQVEQDLELSAPAMKVYDLLQEVHKCSHEFRIVVVGNGAILETTQKLGPTFTLNKSPQTGEPLLTLASHDKRFEFHIKVNQVSKICLNEKQAKNKTMRVLRFLTDKGAPMCSLICSEDAVEWFEDMVEKYGTEVQL